MSKRQRDAFGGPNKKAAKNRFRKLVRNVILNMQWLNEAAEDTGISLNVKKNVAMSVRQKRKVGMMTMAEKSLLRTPHHTRTVDERKKLCNILANLACFSKFAPKVRARLVPHIKFMAVNPGRTIMNEGDIPVTIYFIIAGEVEMSRNVYNKATKLFELHSEAIFGPGDCIGDIDVLENSPRTNTYVATSNCELLVVYKNTYEQVLQQSMQKLWQEKKDALKALDYFEFFNEEQIVNACKYANIHQFDTLETIYTEDQGSMSSVYFVLSGECVILQCLHMKVNLVNREKVYQLAKVTKMLSVDEIAKDKNEAYFDVQDYVMTTSSDDEKSQNKTRGLRKMGLQEIQKGCADMNRTIIRRSTKTEGLRPKARRNTRNWEKENEGAGGKPKRKRELYERYLTGMVEGEEEEGYDLSESQDSSHSLSTLHSSVSSELNVENETEGSEIFTATNESHGSVHTRDSGDDLDKDRYETHFIDVGSLSYGGIFGLGEKMAHRVIMARTTVQCILIPRFWLLEAAQNPGNLWQRKRFYIECNIPTREALFKNFLKTRKWEKFRHDYIQEILASTTLTRFTKVEDIPIISRIVETRADDV
ncbi:uncharacterized protein [Drosophila kikkawai]|uniref:Cyclic nucleotide-binding domain-containing protein n=1 Tax=Drosophila kikkawai TaxID=30033 RepID=A0A6P4J306_DROKI|nr:uncharacterized protein LOC108079169 [Drosophila kikkawai]